MPKYDGFSLAVISRLNTVIARHLAGRGNLRQGRHATLAMTVNKQIVILNKPAKDRPRRQNVIAGKNKQLFLFRVGAVFVRGYAEFDFELLYKIRKRVVTRGGTDFKRGFIRSD